MDRKFEVSISVSEDKTCSVLVNRGGFPPCAAMTGLTPEQAVAAKEILQHAYRSGRIDSAQEQLQNAMDYHNSLQKLVFRDF